MCWQFNQTHQSKPSLCYSTHLKSKEVRIPPVYLKPGLVSPVCFNHVDLWQGEFECYTTHLEGTYTKPTSASYGLYEWMNELMHAQFSLILSIMRIPYTCMQSLQVITDVMVCVRYGECMWSWTTYIATRKSTVVALQFSDCYQRDLMLRMCTHAQAITLHPRHGIALKSSCSTQTTAPT